MANFFTFLALLFIFTLRSELLVHCISPTNTLTYGSSLSVDNSNDVLTSQNGVFSAGFYEVGYNAFCFAIWFTRTSNKAVSWMANRDQPVIGKYSILKLKKNGNLKLKSLPVDGSGGTNALTTIWSSNTISEFPLQLQLLDSGNLVLNGNSSKFVAWQSFDSPTDTLLPSQLLTGGINLISSRSETDCSSGYYNLSFGEDDVLHLLFDDPTMKPSIYWPDHERSTRNHSKIAWFDSLGYFNSSDGLAISAADLGLGLQRRLTLDFDGNLRMYSLQEDGEWKVVWIALQEQCKVHGLCGSNSLCRYDPSIGRRCTCLPGYKLRNSTDWSYGCEPEFDLKKRGLEIDFVEIPHVRVYTGGDVYSLNYTLRQCEDICRGMQSCKAFVMKINKEESAYRCYIKTRLLNGYQSPDCDDVLSIKLVSSYNTAEMSQLKCELRTSLRYHLERQSHGVGPFGFLIWFAVAIGSIEFAVIFLVWCFLFRCYDDDDDQSTSFQGYILAVTGFRRYSYAELKRATTNFREEIGRGGSSVVYKGILTDGRMVAVKKLESADQGKEEFLAEMGIIGRIRHMNLIETLGYCAEGKDRLLVFEFMENRSLAENMCSNSLEWRKRYKIALGTARGLAYLHEECLEWVLHCDVKPQNVLLDSNFEPKVGDFGLSKLLNRGRGEDSYFSRIRGTRGYMAPEWISHAPITSKVDVYSYGVVVLQLVTGKSPSEVEPGLLATRLKEKKKKNAAGTSESWVEEVADPTLEGNYDVEEMGMLALVALQCVEEEKDARPTMSQVVDMLQKPHE